MKISTAEARDFEYQMSFCANRLLIATSSKCFCVVARSFSQPISLGTNFALISRVELVFLSASRVSPHFREDAALRPDERKQIRIARGRRDEPLPFPRGDGSESKLEIYRDRRLQQRLGWVLRVQVSVNTLPTWNLRIPSSYDMCIPRVLGDKRPNLRNVHTLRRHP